MYLIEFFLKYLSYFIYNCIILELNNTSFVECTIILSQPGSREHNRASAIHKILKNDPVMPSVLLTLFYISTYSQGLTTHKLASFLVSINLTGDLQ